MIDDTQGTPPMTPTDKPDATEAAERVRRLNNYVAMCLRDKLVAPMVLDLREVLKAYAEQSAEIAELRAKLAKYDDATLVDEADIREAFRTDEITTLHYRSGGKQLRIDRKDIAFSFGVMSDGGVFYGPHKIRTRGQLTHLLDGLGVRA